MSTLVINSPVRACCGQHRDQCQCHGANNRNGGDLLLAPSLTDMLINEQAVASKRRGDDLAPGARQTKGSDRPSTEDFYHTFTDDGDDYDEENRRRLSINHDPNMLLPPNTMEAVIAANRAERRGRRQPAEMTLNAGIDDDILPLPVMIWD